MKFKNDIFIFICIVFLMSNVAMSGYIITRSFKAQRQRTDTQNIVKSFECVLLIQPQNRTEQNVAECHK